MRVLCVTFAILLAAACSSSEEGDSLVRVGDRPSSGDGDGGGADTGVLEPSPSGGPSCTNGARDGDESDVDCGGGICPPCANAAACVAPRDCVSLVCSGGKCANDMGCSDGTREAFAPPSAFPNVAACSGGWSIAGLGTTTAPACGGAAGNDSANPTGAGCNVADLCQAGWHVCSSAAEVGMKSGGAGCAGAAIAGQNAFFVIRQGGPGNAQCGAGTNDLFGCGDVGAAPDPATCAPLDRFSNELCAALPATWSCGTNGADEVNNVAKTASEGGGVLCCRD